MKVKVFKKKAYDIIYSIGQDCGCAFYMQRHNLRTFAGPMDWITGASLDYRFELILNDFKGFLEKDNLRPLDIENSESNKKYDLYQCVHSDFKFFHDFKAEAVFDESFRDVKSKYERRIKRFYKKIKASDKVLLVWFSRYENYDNALEIEYCKRLMKKMSKEIDFLFIEHNPSKAIDEVERIDLSPNITKFVLNTAILNGTDNETLGNATLCDRIFEQYGLKPKKNVAKNILFGVVKFISMFIFFTSERKKIRRHLTGIVEKIF